MNTFKPKVPFILLGNKTAEDLEQAIIPFVKEKPLLLANLKRTILPLGFEWQGPPSEAIQQMATLAVKRDHHPQPVDFVVMREQADDPTYLAKNPNFMMEAVSASPTAIVTSNPNQGRTPQKQVAVRKPQPSTKTNPFNLNSFSNVWVPQKSLDALKNLAQEENWTIDSDYPDGVLKQYLKLTYARLEQQRKVYSGDGCLLFNTGLFDKDYEAIYAYMTPNKNPGMQPWVCSRFERKDDPIMRKNLPEDLSRATWFDSFEDLFFDARKDVFPNYDHCMLENAMRLPHSLLKYVVNDNEEFQRLTEFFAALKSATKDTIRSIAENFGIDFDPGAQEVNAFRDPKQILSRCFLQRLPGFEGIRRRLTQELDNAIGLARKIVASDYAAAVPTFYPTKNSFALMLPLSFDNPSVIDCALVTVKNQSGAYEGVTLFTIGMAYSNARILRKPDAHWMTQCFVGLQ